MADPFNEGSSTSKVSGGLDSTIELNIKTLDSRMYSFQVDKNMMVSAFKEKIANEVGVPVGRQRLIFRGRVLKDEHCLSEYQVENGHTLHLVTRQSQSSVDTGSGDTNTNNGNRGSDTGVGGPRIGQISSHSVLLGTFNVGDQVEGIVPDVTQVIGALLNSFGIGGQGTGFGGMQPPTMAPQGNETGGSRSTAGGQSQAQNQTQTGQAFSGQSFQLPSQAVQMPLNAAVPLPSFYAPIPDSLSTLSEFMTRMEQVLAQNGYQRNTSSTNAQDTSRGELPSNSRGLPTVEALSIVLRHAERLLSGHAIAALSHIAGRLEQAGATSDPTMRAQIQQESVQIGLAMQHLGALFLELGRTILTLRMGQSSAESSVNAGPAVYISHAGPNPIMAQPFPLQTNSLFGSSLPPSSPMTLGPVGIGNAPRHINIHIHAGTALAPVVSTLGPRASNGENLSADRSDGPGSAGTGPARVLPVRNVVATVVPPRSTGVGVANALESGSGVSVSQLPPDSGPLSSMIADINSRLRNFAENLQLGNLPTQGSTSSGISNVSGDEHTNSVAVTGAEESNEPLPESQSDNQKEQDVNKHASNNEGKEILLSSKDEPAEETPSKSERTSEDAPSSSVKCSLADGPKTAPLGLGLGSLERKKRVRQPKPLDRSGDTVDATINQNLDDISSAQQLLRSIASHGSAGVFADNTPPGQTPTLVERNPGSRSPEEQGSDNQFGASSALSAVLQSPALSGLLSGVSQQTEFGSPNVLRTMLQRLSQNPQLMSTVSQIAQQVDSQNIENMFSSLGSGQGGGIDLSRMVQQMMPVVSQVLGSGSVAPPLFSSLDVEPQMQHNERSLSAAEMLEEIDLREVSQRVEHSDAPADIFRAVVESAVRLNGTGSSPEEIIHELTNDEDLVRDYMEMLRHDIHRRVEGDYAPDKC